MKKQNLQDERVILERRKINSDAYSILFIALLASVLIQQYILNAPREQYAAELICFIGISIYTVARHLMLGHSIFGDSKRAKYMPFVNSITTGVVATVINGVLNYSNNSEYYEGNIGMFIAVLAITFFSVSLFTYVVLSCLGYLNKKRQEKILKQLDDE